MIRSQVDKYERELTEWTSVDATTLLYSVRRRVSVYKRLLQTTEGSVHKYVRHVCLQGGHDPFAQDLHDTVKNLLFHTEDLYECTAELLNLHISIASHRSHFEYHVSFAFCRFLDVRMSNFLAGGGGGGSWGVYFAWEISCFKLTAKFTTQILGHSAKFPKLVVGTTKFSFAPSAPLCSLCILSGSGSQVVLRCCWQSVCLSRPLISVVVWREFHAPCEVSIYAFSWALFFSPLPSSKAVLVALAAVLAPGDPPRVVLEVPTAPPAGGCLWGGSPLFWQLAK